MRLLKVLSLIAALALLGGAVLDAQTGLVRQALTAAPDAGKKPPNARGDNNALGNADLYMPASKAGPLIRSRDLEPEPGTRPPPQQQEQSPAQQSPSQAAPQPARKDAGK